MSRGVITNIVGNSIEVENPKTSRRYISNAVSRDLYEVGDNVEIADIDNESLEKNYSRWNRLKLLPVRGNYTYIPETAWYRASTLESLNKLASLAKSYLFFTNWQKTCPYYRLGEITSIIDAKYVNVRITNRHTASTSVKRCRVDYMTCDATAASVGDAVIVKFQNADARRPYVVGFWEDPPTCDVYLYFEVELERWVLETEEGESISESSGSSSSESYSSSSSSHDSSSSESSADSVSSSSSATVADYGDDRTAYAFVWDIVNQAFAVINDPDGNPIQFPCQVGELAEWYYSSSELEITQTMYSAPAGRESVSKRFFGGNKTNLERWYVDCIPGNNCSENCGSVPYNTQHCCEEFDTYRSPEYWADFYNNIFARCGECIDSWSESNPYFTSETDEQSYYVRRLCTPGSVSGHEENELIAWSDIQGVRYADDITEQGNTFFPSLSHVFGEFSSETRTTEYYSWNKSLEWDNYISGGPPSGYLQDNQYATYRCETPIGNLSEFTLNNFEFYSNLYDNPQTWRAEYSWIDGVGYGYKTSNLTFMVFGYHGRKRKVICDNQGSICVTNPEWYWDERLPIDYKAYCIGINEAQDPFLVNENGALSSMIEDTILALWEENPNGFPNVNFNISFRSGTVVSYSSLSSESSSSDSSSSNSSSKSSSSSSESSSSVSSNSSYSESSSSWLT
jgi:hypothetical protein